MRKEPLNVRRGQVYLARLNGVGSEQRGKRPVVVVQNNTGNRFSPTTIVAPITSVLKHRQLPVHVPLYGQKLYKNSMVLCEQIQVMDKSRLGKQLCELSENELNDMNAALAVSIDVAGGKHNVK